jgi:PAS domain S-box-containing protein
LDKTSPVMQVTDQLRLLVEAVGDYAIFVLDPGGHVLTWNVGARRIKGYAPEDIVGQHFSVFYTPEDVARDHPAEELEIASREGHFEEEGWRVRKDGSRFWANVLITALRDEHGDLVGYGKVTRDLTARRLSEEQLLAQTAELKAINHQLDRLRLLVGSVRDYAIFTLDAGGHVLTWNLGAKLIKGYSADEVIGRHFSLFYPPEARGRNHPAEELEVAAREGRFEEEGWRVRKDGSRFWASVVITALRNDAGTLVGYGKVVRDLTARREADEDLRRTAKELERSNADLDRFASAAAHDLAEPLHTIAGLADLIDRRHGAALGDEAREALAHIRSGTERLRARVDGLLAYSRASHAAMRRERVDVREALGHVLAALRARLDQREAQVSHAVDGLGVVMADSRLLEAVLQNLIANALKFNDGERPRIEISAEPVNGAWRLSVADDGIGIAPEYHDQIFGLFSRLHAAEHYPGTGMGLAMCRRIIERHGGDMGVDSIPGEGSRFWFTLPAAEAGP